MKFYRHKETGRILSQEDIQAFEHLRALNVKVTKEMPDRVCTRCGANNWWFRPPSWGPGEWLCGRCHPKPGGINNREEGVS